MVIEITDLTLKRLNNYEAVLSKESLEADKLQWRVMTREVMQAAELARTRAREISALVAYARYLNRIQSGRNYPRSIYGEPLLSQALADLLEKLSIERTMVAEGILETHMAVTSNVPTL